MMIFGRSAPSDGSRRWSVGWLASADHRGSGGIEHWGIALIEKGTRVLVLGSGDPTRLAGSVAELASLGARIIRIGSGSDDTCLILLGPSPAWGPLESVLAFQHLARCLAVTLGRNTDTPRNLAKSVTML